MGRNAQWRSTLTNININVFVRNVGIGSITRAHGTLGDDIEVGPSRFTLNSLFYTTVPVIS